MFSTPSPFPWRTAGIGLLTMLLMAGFVFSVILPAQARFTDEHEYLAFSRNLLHGPGFSMDGVHLTAMRPPGYAFFITAIQAMGGGIVAIRFVQYLLLGATIWMVARFCPENTRDKALVAVTLLVTLYALLFFTASTLYPQTLGAFLFVSVLSLILISRRGILLDLATGLTFGVLILVIPTFLLTLFVVLGMAYALKIINWRNAVLITMAAAIMTLTWTARNYALFHQFVPVASNSGENFLIGNCENTSPTGGSGNVDRTHYMEEARAQGLDEFQTDHYFRQAALTWMREHPTQAFVLYLEKTLNFFNVYNQYAAESKTEVSPGKQLVVAVTYGTLLALLVWRLSDTKRFPLTRNDVFFLSIFVLSAFTSAIFITRIRLRIPYDYLIIAVIASYLAQRFFPLARTATRTPSR